MKKVWILADDRAGNVNQLLGIAEVLDYEYVRKDISYNQYVKLPNFLRDKTLIGLTKETVQSLKTTDDYPDIVLSAGRRSFLLLVGCKKNQKVKQKLFS